MTVPVAPRYQNFVGSGTTGPFSFTFPILISSTGVPYITVTRISAAGVQTPLAYPADYSFTAVQLGLGGGIVNTTVAIAGDGSRLFIEATTPLDQAVKYSNQGDFFPETHEKSYDKLHYIAQEQARTFSLCIKIPSTDVAGLTVTLPTATSRANKMMAFDANGNVIVSTMTLAAIEAGATSAAASAVAAAASAVTAAASQTAAGVSEINAAASAAAAAAAAAAAGMKYRQVRAASTANVASLSGTTTIDGVSLVANDRLLLKNQSTASQNGIYTIAAGAWSRSTDMDTWAEVPGTVVVVTEGTVNGDKVFLCTSNDGGTLGSTSITFVDWAAAIFDGTITAAKLASDSVTTVKILDSNVTTAKIADANVTTAKIADNNVTLAKLATQAANTILANPTASTAVPTAVVIAANKFAARASTGDLAAKDITDFALSLLDDADAATMRTTLGITTPVFTKSYESAATVITSGGSGTFTHGMGVSPKMYFGVLQCVTADLGYAVGDEIQCQNGEFNGNGINLYVDAGNTTTIKLWVQNLLRLPTKGGGVDSNITFANWKLVVRAYA